jgi:hypothetical protein
MKKTRNYIFIGLIAVIGVGQFQQSALAQTATPEATVRSFYSWYLHELNSDREPITNSQGLSKFVTARLLKAIGRALKRDEGINADLFIDAQDFDPLWEKNISTAKAVIRGDRASVTVTLKGGPVFGTKRLKVGLKKETGAWKIDSVNGVLSP